MSTKHANIITTTYASAKDLELAMERIQGMRSAVEDIDGLCAVVFVRTDETTTKHLALYKSPAQAEAGAKALFPQFQAAVGPHVGGEPVLEGGEVLFDVLPA